MRADTGTQSADGMREDGRFDEDAAVQRIHHGNMGGKIAAPAHADGGEHGDLVHAGRSVLQHRGDQRHRRAGGAHGSDGERDAAGVAEAEQEPGDRCDKGA